MGLKIAVAKETADAERRVAVSPETIKKLKAAGCTVMIEKAAGEAASITDDMLKNAGGIIAKGKADLYKAADIILRVSPPSANEIDNIPEKALLISLLAPHENENLLKTAIKKNIQLLSMEKVPRITRAQSMDVLSSQSNLAGYKAVLDAAGEYNRAFPMMMTAAGTVPPAKVFIMGAGVAGLQAIATARRLGAIVTATDVRPAAKEQVESLGASFVAVEDEEFKEAETAGGYAKEMSEDYQKKQAKLVEEHIAKQDIVITTALIPGRPAPRLVSKKMLSSMKPGSVLVDLAVESGGNVEGSKAGSIVEIDGVKIIGHKNIPSRLATDASALYAKNVLNLLMLILDKDSGKLAKDWQKDEIIEAMLLNNQEPFQVDTKAAAKKAAPKKPAAKTAAAKKATTKKATPKKSTSKAKAVKK